MRDNSSVWLGTKCLENPPLLINTQHYSLINKDYEKTKSMPHIKWQVLVLIRDLCLCLSILLYALI